MILSSYTSKRFLFIVAISGLSITAAIVWILRQEERKKNMSRGAKASQQAIADANSGNAAPPKTNSSDIVANENNDLRVTIHEDSMEFVGDNRTSNGQDFGDSNEEKIEHKLLTFPSPFSQESEKTACSIEEVLSGEEHPSFNWAEDVDREEELSSKLQAQSLSDTNGETPGSGASDDHEYKNAESPSIRSTNSEGSADSGRATGGPTVYSPFDLNDPNYPPIYEFEIPNTLVGLIIGIKGKTIRLTLPHGAPCEVFISAPVDAGHFFLQLPTHPSFDSLQQLDYHMLGIYSQINQIPELPKPCTPGILCASPAYNGWYRAVTLLYDEAQDEMLVRFVDYGGFARVPRADLKQIRTDLMTLPFQAIECYLAHVQPIDGTSHWSEEANELFTSLCMSKIIQAELVGHNKNDSIPYVELQVFDEEKKLIKIHEILLEKGLAKPADPSRLIELPKLTIPANNNGVTKLDESKENTTANNNDEERTSQPLKTVEAN